MVLFFVGNTVHKKPITRTLSTALTCVLKLLHLKQRWKSRLIT